MTNNWQRLIFAAAITLNLTIIDIDIVQAFAFKIEIEEPDVDLNVLGGLASNLGNITQILHLIREKSKPSSFNQGLTVSN